MREDIKLKKYKDIYKKINDNYCNNYLNVTECCDKVGISTSTYYKICKKLGKKSVGSEINNKTKKNKISNFSKLNSNVSDLNSSNKNLNSNVSDLNSSNKNVNSIDSHILVDQKMNSQQKRQKKVSNQKGGVNKSQVNIDVEDNDNKSTKRGIKNIKNFYKTESDEYEF
jgi:hypothetical protein